MNSDDIREMIQSRINKEEYSQSLYKYLADEMQVANPEKCFTFIVIYIQLTSDLLDVICTEAQNNGVLTFFQPIFDTVLGYWSEGCDFIPDDIGLQGLCDNAYLSLALTQSIADTQVPNTNQKLFELDLRQANTNMRNLIGEPTASCLDAMVRQTHQSIVMQNTMSALFPYSNITRAISFGGLWRFENDFMIEADLDTALGSLCVV